MKLPLETHPGVAVITVSEARLDAARSNAFKKRFHSLPIRDANAIIDMRNVQYVDSSGLGALISCLRVRAKHGGSLKLCSMTGRVQAMFELVRMNRVFQIYHTRRDAIQSCE